MNEDMIPMESTNPIGLYERAIEGANARGIYTDATTIIEVHALPDTHTHDRC
jgi:hypothetical protein